MNERRPARWQDPIGLLYAYISIDRPIDRLPMGRYGYKNVYILKYLKKRKGNKGTIYTPKKIKKNRIASCRLILISSRVSWEGVEEEGGRVICPSRGGFVSVTRGPRSDIPDCIPLYIAMEHFPKKDERQLRSLGRERKKRLATGRIRRRDDCFWCYARVVSFISWPSHDLTRDSHLVVYLIYTDAP